MRFEVTPQAVFRGFLGIVAVLCVIHITILVARLGFGHERVFGLRVLFDFEEEKNAPTLYSSFALLFSAALLALIAIHHRRVGTDFGYWLGLALLFGLLSLDEIAQFHEEIGPAKEGRLAEWRVSGWIIPYATGLVAFVVGYTRFLLRLPRRYAGWFIGAGSIFVTGAVGFELAGPFAKSVSDVVYAICYTCEELFEMLGVVVFIYGLLAYVATQFGSLTVVVRGQGEP
jgi:hypothetical protein